MAVTFSCAVSWPERRPFVMGLGWHNRVGRGTAGREIRAALCHQLRLSAGDTTHKRIRAQNSGQGALILSTAFSLACKALETGKKVEEGLPDLSPSKPCALGEHREPQPHKWDG